ncbi:MAG TPA: hypothetical protein VFV10_10995 [Gammaproteobacteria bacterium]|nr:hypothetical protein [Gammaproteobacteria bacterium]
MPDIVNLPANFIGKDDEQRLESFGGHLIAHGCATRWHWNREGGIDVAFDVFRGGSEERLFVSISRDRQHDKFIARNARGRLVADGPLDHVMAVVDKLARSSHRDEPA